MLLWSEGPKDRQLAKGTVTEEFRLSDQAIVPCLSLTLGFAV